MITDEVINIPTIQIDTPVDYSSSQPLPSELMDSIKNRLPTLDQVEEFYCEFFFWNLCIF
jgi:hypothetical protein